MNQNIQLVPAPSRNGTDYELQQAINDVKVGIEDLAEKVRRLSVSLSAIPTSEGQIDDGLTDAMRAVLLVVEKRWPDGKPIGMRKGRWCDDIEQACRDADVTAANRTIRKALTRQKNWQMERAKTCHNLPKTD
jgi:hypothetical protein